MALTKKAKAEIKRKAWKARRKKYGKLGRAARRPDGTKYLKDKAKKK